LIYHSAAVEHKIHDFCKLVREIVAAAFPLGTDVTLLAHCYIHEDSI
jgi:hypothetical protein